MSGELIAQAIGAIGGGVQQARERQRAWDIQDQQLAQTADRFEAEKLFRSSMLENAQRQLQAQQAAAARLEEDRAAQAQQYEEAVQALVARGVPEGEARVIARDQVALRSQFAPPPEPKAPRTQYDSGRGGLINLDDGTFQPIQGLPAAPAGAGRAPRTQFDATTGRLINLDDGTSMAIEGIGPRQAPGKTLPPSTINELSTLRSLGRKAATLALESPDESAQGGTGAIMGRMPADIANWIDRRRGLTAGIPLRAGAAAIAGEFFKMVSGAAVTASEAKRLEPFIPNPKDDEPDLKRKAAAFAAEMEAIIRDREAEFARNGYRIGGDMEAAGGGEQDDLMAELDALRAAMQRGGR